MSHYIDRCQHEKAFFDSVVHGLRQRGWSRIEAEEEALNRVEAMRARKAVQS